MTPQSAGSEDVWVSTVWQYHPQLTEKAIVDLVNGIEVVEDHLRCRNPERPLLNRIWSAVTGKTLREQYIVDINLMTGLDAVSEWLQDLQMFQAKSDLALALVSEKLVETRDQLADGLDEVTAAVDSVLKEVDARLESVCRRVQELEMRDKARNHLDLIITCSGNPSLRKLPPLAQAFIEIDELWWGDFGAYCRMMGSDEVKTQLVKIAHGKLSELFAHRMGLAIHEIVATEDLLRPLANLGKNESELIAYLADYSAANRIPLIRTIACFAAERLDCRETPNMLPLALSPSGLTNRLILESRRATSEIRR